MDPIGRKVRISSDVVRLRHISVSNPLRMNTNAPSSGAESLAGMTGTIIGYSSGRDYGEGMYDPALYIVKVEMPDGSVRSLRIDTDLVEFLTPDDESNETDQDTML